MDPLVRINEVFAQAVYANYKRKRYGLKTCSALINEELADDLRNLLIRSNERTACNSAPVGFCTLSKIQEKINTI